MKRRVFLELGGALSAVALMPFAARASGSVAPAAPPSRQLAPQLLLVDRRAAQGRARAAQASRSGIAVASVEDDVTRFFYERLHGRWREQLPVMAGLTGYAPYFCLSQLARDQDMRLILQEELADEDGHPLYAWIAVPRLGLPASTPA